MKTNIIVYTKQTSKQSSTESGVWIRQCTYGTVQYSKKNEQFAMFQYIPYSCSGSIRWHNQQANYDNHETFQSQVSVANVVVVGTILFNSWSDSWAVGSIDRIWSIYEITVQSIQLVITLFLFALVILIRSRSYHESSIYSHASSSYIELLQ